jgi:hypothetical protein
MREHIVPLDVVTHRELSNESRQDGAVIRQKIAALRWTSL